jgi:hypothetical protein
MRGDKADTLPAMQLRGVMAALVLASLTEPALADDADIARADKLFEEGRALVTTDFAAACEKFRESLAVSAHALGALLNVARCDEEQGRFASAYARYKESRDRARESGSDIERKVAEDHMAALAPKVPKVTLRFVEPPLPDTKIVVDDQVLRFSEIANYPLDPGEHELVVSAPGYIAFRATVTLTEGENKDVEIPKLARALRESSRRTIGKYTTGAGIAAVGASAVLGLIAYRKYHDADCGRIDTPDGERLHCSGEAIGEPQSARTLGNVATVVGAVGLAATGVGLYLWLRAPDEQRGREPRVTLVPQLGPESAGVAAVGRF